jgi:phage terminase small subunit
MTKRLTEKQRRFVEAYMGEAAGNATEAARMAGYGGDDPTDAYLASMGSENLRKPKIQAAIAERVAADPKIASREERQQFWTQVMYDEDQRMKDRLKAAELLGKTQADFIQRHQVNAEIDAQTTYTLKIPTSLEDDPTTDD